MKNKKELPKPKTAKNKDRKEGRKWKRNGGGDKSQQGQERQKPGWSQGKMYKTQKTRPKDKFPKAPKDNSQKAPITKSHQAKSTKPKRKSQKPPDLCADVQPLLYMPLTICVETNQH